MGTEATIQTRVTVNTSAALLGQSIGFQRGPPSDQVPVASASQGQGQVSTPLGRKTGPLSHPSYLDLPFLSLLYRWPRDPSGFVFPRTPVVTAGPSVKGEQLRVHNLGASGKVLAY